MLLQVVKLQFTRNSKQLDTARPSVRAAEEEEVLVEEGVELVAGGVWQTDTAVTTVVTGLLRLTFLLPGVNCQTVLLTLRMKGSVVEEGSRRVLQVQAADITMEERRSDGTQPGVELYQFGELLFESPVAADHGFVNPVLNQKGLLQLANTGDCRLENLGVWYPLPVRIPTSEVSYQIKEGFRLTPDHR